MALVVGLEPIYKIILVKEGMEKNYFVLYDNNDYIVCYFDNIREFAFKYNYQYYELRRKFKNSKTNFINLILDNVEYKLYSFS